MRLVVRFCGLVAALASFAAGAQPEAPAGLYAVPGDEAAVLRWNGAGNAAILRYQVRLRAGDSTEYSAWADLPDSGPQTDRHTVSELANGTRYTFELRAVDDDGAGAAAWASTTLAASPSSVVAVPDAYLRDLLKLYLGLAANAPITQGHLAKLNSLSSGGQIADLTGLEFALNLADLQLNNSRIDDISALSGLNKLYLLSVEGSNISDLSPLSEVHALKFLSLAGNKISDVSALSDLPVLLELDLSGNAISDASPLSGLPALRTLELWNNDISELRLSGLPELTRLEAGRNELSHLQLSGLPTLRSLELPYNKLSNTSALSDLPALRYLDLSANEVADVSGLSGLTALRWVDLPENEISDVSSLSGMPTLESLNLRDNKILELKLFNLPRLRDLQLIGNNTISSVSLSNLFLVPELHLGYNEITDISLRGLFSLRELSLRNNKISDISTLSDGVPALQYLELTANRITDISALSGLTGLRWLQLGGNDVSDIWALSRLSALTLLDLTSNQITDVSPLAGLTSVWNLRLGGNEVSDISALSGMTSLSVLILTANQVTDISPLSGLPRLSGVVLSGNQLSDISALEGSSGMRDLWLSGNRISDVSALAGMPALKRLRLDDNAISDISALAGLDALSTVFLNRNAIVDFSPLVTSGMANTEAYVDLRGNPRNAAQEDDVRALRESGAAVLFDDGSHLVPLFPSAVPTSFESSAVGFVRVINHSDAAGSVSIRVVDKRGERRGPVSLPIGAGQAKHFNAADLEQGNPGKGLLPGLGEAVGDWRLVLRSELDIEVLSYARTPDGFVASLHDLAAEAYGTSWVPTFNRANNESGVSRLRLVNPTDFERRASIDSSDDASVSGKWSSMTMFVPPRRTRDITATHFESLGLLRGGVGKWRLTAESPAHWMMSVLRSPAGHLANTSTRTAAPQWRVRAYSSWERGGLYRVPLFPAASSEIHGFLRIANLSGRTLAISLRAVDHSGTEHEPTSLVLTRGETLQLSAADLEQGNAAKGVSAIGAGVGDWHLEITGDRRFEVLTYAGVLDGFYTSLHDVAPSADDGSLWIPFFNPGSNRRQASRLRLVNWGETEAEVTINGVDDAGESPGEAVRVTMPARSARDYMSWELETGTSDGMSGALGDGTGKWRLRVSTTSDIEAMSLLHLPTGHIANVSTTPRHPPNL